MKILEIPADILRVAQLFRAVRDVRYYLKGVHFRTIGFELIVESTNGSTACKMVAPSMGDFADCNFTLPCDFKIPKKLDTICIATDDFKQFDISLDTVTIHEQHIDATYPSIDQIIPITTSGIAGQYDPDLLMRFRTTSMILGKGAAYTLQHNGMNAARVNIDKFNFIGVVMPWRVK